MKLTSRTLLALSILLASCGFGPYEEYTFERHHDMPQDALDEGPNATMSLNLGHLQASGEFNIVTNIVTSVEQEVFQVSATISETNSLDPDLIRVKFSSDLYEWIGITDSGINVYSSMLECELHSYNCDEINVGSGISGYFFPSLNSQNRLSIQNAYCRKKDEDYSYTITAAAYSIEFFEPVQITSYQSIEVQCLQDHDTF